MFAQANEKRKIAKKNPPRNHEKFQRQNQRIFLCHICNCFEEKPLKMDPIADLNTKFFLIWVWLKFDTVWLSKMSINSGQGSVYLNWNQSLKRIINYDSKSNNPPYTIHMHMSRQYDNKINVLVKTWLMSGKTCCATP